MGRLSQRNKQPIWWANFVSLSPTYDEYGNENGSVITYSEPVQAFWNVGFVESEAEVQAFGIQAVDTLRIVAEKKDFPLTVESVLWFGKEPESPYDVTSPKHNYAVAGIRPSLNEMVFYARRVEVS